MKGLVKFFLTNKALKLADTDTDFEWRHIRI